MLVLSRRKGERIVIDDRITITVVACRGGRAVLGIDAPAEVSIEREELRRRVESQTGGRPSRSGGTPGADPDRISLARTG